MRRFRALPVRWRLALISAGLTLAILLLFALVIEAFTTNRLRSDFDAELRVTVADLEEKTRVQPDAVTGQLELVPPSPEVVDAASAGDAAIRIVYPDGRVLRETPGAPALGPPRDGVRNAGEYRVVSRAIFAGGLQNPVAYVQYGKPQENLGDTIDRLRLFLALGVLGGAGLALIAGLTLARRAMGPIAELTHAARDVANTRDPRVELPKSEADDEVADLARTLEEMLMALDAARGETEATLARQREFVADASHELRTPLTSILANLELLEAELQGEDKEVAGSALRSSHRMRRLVADLLLLARADAGRAPARDTVDLGEVIREAAGEVVPIARDHELAVDADEALFVSGVADDLLRMARNLIENAVRHTPPGTAVEIRAGNDAPPPGGGNGSPGAGDVVLEVTDDGPGIPAELRPRVFERFVGRARDAGDRSAGGSGLGLAIVAAVAETHGGSVSLSDGPGGGARFVVRLPAVAAPAPTERPVAPA